MKKIITFLLVMALANTFLFAQIDVKTSRPLTYAKIAEKAAIKWPNDFVMQKHTIEEQCKAYNEFVGLKQTYPVPDNIYNQVMIDALEKWSDNDWTKCVNNNDGEKVFACLGADWTMVVYTMKEQIEAYNSISSDIPITQTKSSTDTLVAIEIKKETFADPRDGKVYKIVTIGNQTWFAENLAYKTNVGCWAYDKKENNISIYGYLYNWEIANTVCPTGWHLANDDEWTILINYFGGEHDAGGKLKEANTNHWKSPNISATNESEFSLIPSGNRSNAGDFLNLTTSCYLWTSTEYDSSSAWWRCIDNKSSIVGRSHAGNKDFGFAVRCIKD